MCRRRLKQADIAIGIWTWRQFVRDVDAGTSDKVPECMGVGTQGSSQGQGVQEGHLCSAKKRDPPFPRNRMDRSIGVNLMLCEKTTDGRDQPQKVVWRIPWYHLLNSGDCRVRDDTSAAK